jgi:hypothetical protein
MVVMIGLQRGNYETMLHDVSPESPAHTILHRSSVELDRRADEEPFSQCVVIECSQEEAMALVDAAKQHCPEALPDIEYGLKLSRAFDLIV